MHNIPYKKEYNEKGELLNPITKHNPYLSRGTYYVPDGKGGQESSVYPNHSEMRSLMRGKRGKTAQTNVTISPVIKRIKRHLANVSRAINRAQTKARA